MPLVQAKCTNCGASLEVESTNDAAICKFCNTPFIVEKAVNNYNISNNNNINAAVVNIYGGNSADFVIRAGSLEKYTGAATSITIPNSVTSIGDSAFSGCRGLSSVIIPDSVTSIGDSAFSGCRGLSSVIIPNSVTFIGDSVFSGCWELSSVTISNNVTSIGAEVFRDCVGLNSIVLPECTMSIGRSAFEGCTDLTSINIPNSATVIEGEAFSGCKKLRNIVHSENININNFRGTLYFDVKVAQLMEAIDAKEREAKLKAATESKKIEVVKTKSGCYIATSIYGSYNCPEVIILRRFRDNLLSKFYIGRLFINAYYAVSPTLVKWFGETKFFIGVFKPILNSLVKILKKNRFSDSPYDDIK